MSFLSVLASFKISFSSLQNPSYQGTSCASITKTIFPFKLGAFMPGLPVQPVIGRLPHNTWDTHTWSFQNLVKCILLTGCQFYTSLELEYLPVYIPNDLEKQSPQLFAENVEKVMSKALNIPVSNNYFENAFLLRECQSLDMPNSTGNF